MEQGANPVQCAHRRQSGLLQLVGLKAVEAHPRQDDIPSPKRGHPGVPGAGELGREDLYCRVPQELFYIRPLFSRLEDTANLSNT